MVGDISAFKCVFSLVGVPEAQNELPRYNHNRKFSNIPSRSQDSADSGSACTFFLKWGILPPGADIRGELSFYLI